jgi:hypothetical protein
VVQNEMHDPSATTLPREILPWNTLTAPCPLTHDAWQLANVLLHNIMQVVAAEVCASLIFPAALALLPRAKMILADKMHKAA